MMKIPYKVDMGGAKLFLFQLYRFVSMMAPCNPFSEILLIHMGSCLYGM